MSNFTDESARLSPFRAFRHRNFSLFWTGQLLSLIGSWMQGLALSWLVLILVDSSLRAQVMSHNGDATLVSHAAVNAAAQSNANYYSGLVNFANGIPLLVLPLFAGVLVDRVNKRRLLIATQVLLAVGAIVLGELVKLRMIDIDWVLILSLLLGIVMAYDMPTRQSFVVELVGRKDLSSAVVLNSSMFNGARALGPAIGGFLLASHVSIADCFFINGASYIPVLAAMLMMRGKGLGDPTPNEAEDSNATVWAKIKVGLDFVKRDHTARNLTILVGSFGTFAFSFNVLIPTLVRYTLLPHASSAEQVVAFGRMETVRGVGALLGALTVAVISTPSRQKTMLIAGSLLATSFLILFALSRTMLLAYITMAVVQFAFIMVFANSNTLMQLTTPDSLRGRVMSIYTLMFIGTTPVGSLMAGIIARHYGAPATTIVLAVISMITALIVCFRRGGLRDLRTTPAHRLNPQKG